MSEKLTALIAEDEPLARQTLRQLVDTVPWLECVGEAADGKTAVSRLDDLEPDIVFLDVHMPELSGLEVLSRTATNPGVVFTTAYDHYAIAAFELGAIDYLLKPFGEARFLRTLERIRGRLVESSTNAVRKRWNDVRGKDPLWRIFARDGNTIVPIPMDGVVQFESADDYVVVHLSAGANLVIALTLSELEKRLDPRRFQRVHRGHIVNLDYLESMKPFDDRRLEITLANGSRVIASRSGSQALRKMVF